MCLIILKPAKKKLDKDLYKRVSEEHRDGAGIAYIKDGNLEIKKGFLKGDAQIFNFDEFYETVQSLDGIDLVIHFRRASPQMKVCADMTHPFLVQSIATMEVQQGEDKVKTPRYAWAMVHNGRLPYHYYKNESDTSAFVDEIIGYQLKRDPYFLQTDAGIWMLENSIGVGNKMAILELDRVANKHEVHIINESVWVKDHGCLFSNDSFKPKPKWPSWADDEDWVQDPVTKCWSAKKKKYDAGKKDDQMVISGYIRFATPDWFGWYWDYGMGRWQNIETNVWADLLESRPTRPPHMKDRPFTGQPKKLCGTLGKPLTYPEIREACGRLKLAIPFESEIVVPDKVTINKGAATITMDGNDWFDKVHKGNVIPLKGPVVPRDAGVIQSLKVVDKDGIESFKDKVPTDHLSKPALRQLRRAAILYCKNPQSGFSEVTNPILCIGLLRHDMQDNVPSLKDAKPEVIDDWIIKALDENPMGDVVDTIFYAMINQEAADEGHQVKDPVGGPIEDPDEQAGPIV